MPSTLTGKIGQAFIGSSAKGNFKRASRARSKLKSLQAIQNRRAFLKQARGAIAANLVAGVGTGAGLDSSAFQGVAQSLQTQEAFGLFEQDISTQLSRQVDRETRRGQEQLARAETAGLLGDIVQTIGSNA